MEKEEILNKQLYDYIQRADLWRADLPNNENFINELYTIFDGIKKVANIIIQCNQEDNKCDSCMEALNSGIENPCKDCNNCKWGLRIGHALEFYELINEEAFNPNKFDERDSDDEDEGGINKQLSKNSIKESEINTDSKREKKDNNEESNNNIEGEQKFEEQDEEQENGEDNDDKYDLDDEDDDQEI